MELKDFWAKTNPRMSVVTHGLISGHVAQVIFDCYLSDGVKNLLRQQLKLDTENLRNFLGYYVSLHDIGKIEINFQSNDSYTLQLLKLEPDYPQQLVSSIRVRHEKTGEMIVRDILKNEDIKNSLFKIIPMIIGAHHPGKTGPSGSSDPVWFEHQKNFEKLMRRHFIKAETFSNYLNSNGWEKGVIGSLLLAIMIISDWISSSVSFENAENWIERSDFEENINNIAKKFIVQSGLLPHTIPFPESFCKLWPNILSEDVRPLQKEVESLFNDDVFQRYRMVLIEAPMGEGKTEAGVFAALRMLKQWGKNGFYIGMPTGATANQMVVRMTDMLRHFNTHKRILLVHSMSWLEHTDELRNGFCDKNEVSDEEIINWLMPTRRGLLGQFAVGTVDQAMLAATTVRFGALRILGLANKVLVIDEIHSYDAYMSEIIKRLLEWCKALDIPVVMLSATLTQKKKEELFASYTTAKLSDSYPQITAILENGSVCERSVEQTVQRMKVIPVFYPFLANYTKIAETAIDIVKDGGCLCILMNTVSDSQKVYSELRQRWSGEVLLFHSQFPAVRRREIENECVIRYGKNRIKRPTRSILVATQVVEQSLDVDFDAMITAVAPIDLLIQRLGRVHRHKNFQRPTNLQSPLFGILIPEEGKGFGSCAYVYPECLMRNAVRVLRANSEIKIPDNIAKLVNDGYESSMVPERELAQWLENAEKNEFMSGTSREFMINSPSKKYNALISDYGVDESNLSAVTRIGEPVLRVALINAEILKKLEPFINKKRGSIDVYSKKLAELVMMNSLTIGQRFFQNDFFCQDGVFRGDKLLSGVWIVVIENNCREISAERILCNDPDLGIVIKEI